LTIAKRDVLPKFAAKAGSTVAGFSLFHAPICDVERYASPATNVGSRR
jgi:hypothetical protein